MGELAVDLLKSAADAMLVPALFIVGYRAGEPGASAQKRVVPGLATAFELLNALPNMVATCAQHLNRPKHVQRTNVRSTVPCLPGPHGESAARPAGQANKAAVAG